MIDPEKLASNSDTPHFSIMFEKFLANGIDTGPVEVIAHYGPRWRLVLDLSSVLPKNFGQILSTRSGFCARLTGANEDISILLTKYNFGGTESEHHAEGRPTKEPIVSGPALDAEEFVAVLLSSPERHGVTIKLEDHHSNTFEILAPIGKSVERRLLVSKISLDASQPVNNLQTLLNFLTFAKGSYCGLGNLRATDHNRSPAFDLIGFTRNDDIGHQANWFDLEIYDKLQEIFLLFSKTMDSAPAQKALKQAIEFYRAASTSRDSSLEMSIIASHSGLEAITNFVLKHLASWSTALVDSRAIAFSDKLRAACGFFGLYGPILQDLPSLLKRSNARNGLDPFELISLFRNKIVHQDPKFNTNGIELFEVWTLAQWLIEILIFGIIGYRGQIVDRRAYVGWRGTTCKIPLSR